MTREEMEKRLAYLDKATEAGATLTVKDEEERLSLKTRLIRWSQRYGEGTSMGKSWEAKGWSGPGAGDDE